MFIKIKSHTAQLQSDVSKSCVTSEIKNKSAPFDYYHQLVFIHKNLNHLLKLIGFLVNCTFYCVMKA